MTNNDRLRIRVGQSVLIRDDSGIEATYEVRANPWQLGHGDWVIGLKGISGGYALDRVVAVGTICPICRRLNPDTNRSCCAKCLPPDDEEIKQGCRLRRLEAKLAAALALTDTGSDEFRKAFPPKSASDTLFPRENVPGWRVVEKIREILLE